MHTNRRTTCELTSPLHSSLNKLISAAAAKHDKNNLEYNSSHYAKVWAWPWCCYIFEDRGGNRIPHLMHTGINNLAAKQTLSWALGKWKQGRGMDGLRIEETLFGLYGGERLIMPSSWRLQIMVAELIHIILWHMGWSIK